MKSINVDSNPAFDADIADTLLSALPPLDTSDPAILNVGYDRIETGYLEYILHVVVELYTDPDPIAEIAL